MMSADRYTIEMLPPGSWVSLADQARARKVEELARELAGYVRRWAIKWDMTDGYRCNLCEGKQPGNISMNIDDDLASIVHTDICIIARARALGLLDS